MVLFHGWGLTVSRLQHYEESVYFLPLSHHEFLSLSWSTSEGLKTVSTLEPSGSFEPATTEWGIQHLNHSAIAP